MTFDYKVGQTVRLRNGSTSIVERVDGNCCWIKGSPHLYVGDGVVFTYESGYDIVAILGDDEVKHSHYKKDVSNISTLDIYRALELFEVRSHSVGHAIKKLLMAGNRGVKDYEQDIQEAIDSLNRELQMKQEDSNG